MVLPSADITTALGLVVAIPALIFYNYMISKNQYFIKEIEFVANQLAEHEEYEAVQV
jgi:biopolymer transport protein ExbB/TolQ